MSKQAVKASNPPKREMTNSHSWRDFDVSMLPQGEKSRFATELTTYRDQLDELLKHEGKFVVIQGTSIIGYYGTREKAIAGAFKKCGRAVVLVKQIVEIEPVVSLGGVL